METTDVPVPVEANFWDALNGKDFDTAYELLKLAIEGKQEPFEDYRENDLLSMYMSHYIIDFGADVTSSKIDSIEFNDDLKSGYICVDYHIYRHGMGCSAHEINKDKTEDISFKIDRHNQKVTVAFLVEQVSADEYLTGQ